jgi:hypothetical protein
MKRIYLIVILILLTAGLKVVTAQNEGEKAKSGPFDTGLNFICTSTSDDSIQLKATITVKHEEGAKMLANAPVKFSLVVDEAETEIGVGKTNFQGIATLKIPVKGKFQRGSDDLFHFKAVYEGDKKFTGSDGEFALKPAKFSIEFYEEDSVKYVKVSAFKVNADGSESPLGPLDVTVAVPRMISRLKVASVSIDSTGSGTAEFPGDIIGDVKGNLEVIASVEEDDTYGNIVAVSHNLWGLPKHLISPDRPSRELWTPIAPLWMIITLVIMLAGVWGHYLYAVIQLVMIKKFSKIGKKDEKE